MISETRAGFNDDEDDTPIETQLQDKRKIKSIIVNNRPTKSQEKKEYRKALIINRYYPQPTPTPVLTPRNEAGSSSIQATTEQVTPPEIIVQRDAESNSIMTEAIATEDEEANKAT